MTAFWEGCERGELHLLRCASCERVHHFEPRRCPACLSTDLASIVASGRGVLKSYTIVHRAPAPSLKGETPYVLGLIDLEEGPRMMARVAIPAGELSVGARVRVTFPERAGRRLPTFVLEQ